VKTLQELIADKLERAGTPSRGELLRIPLENIERWLAKGHSAPHRLQQWRQLILEAQSSAQGFQTLLNLLRDRSEEATHLKSFDPPQVSLAPVGTGFFLRGPSFRFGLFLGVDRHCTDASS
jgi:hypothetical protein